MSHPGCDEYHEQWHRKVVVMEEEFQATLDELVDRTPVGHVARWQLNALKDRIDALEEGARMANEAAVHNAKTYSEQSRRIGGLRVALATANENAEKNGIALCKEIQEHVETKKRIAELEALVAERFKCPQCGMTGTIDSGASDPQGNWIEIECPTCRQERELRQRIAELEAFVRRVADESHWANHAEEAEALLGKEAK